MMNLNDVAMVMLQSGVFEKLVINIIMNASVNHGGRVLLCGEAFSCWVLVCYFTLKSHLLLWIIGEYCRMAGSEKLSKEE